MAKRFNSTENAAREKRMRRFKKIVLQFLAMEEDVHEGAAGSGMYWIESDNYGKIVIYPKGDKLQIVNTGRWVDGVEDWLKNNIITEKF